MVFARGGKETPNKRAKIRFVGTHATNPASISVWRWGDKTE
jgi:hypothetical protein